VVGWDYRLSNFWLANEVNKELKMKLLHQLFCTNIPFAVHFNCAGKKILHLREELQHMTIMRIFFYLSLKYN
jgi:hypothetical protein